MLTKQDFKKLDPWWDKKMDNFAREVLLPTFEQLATKEDLKAFATKEDLKAFATKEWCLENLATKKELKETEFRLERRIEEMESSLRSLINEKFSILAQQINSNMEKFYALIEIMAGKDMLTNSEVKKIAQAGY